MNDATEPEIAAHQVNATEDYIQKGETLFIFKPTLYIFNVACWIALIVVFLWGTMIFFQDLTSENFSWMLMIGLIMFLIWFFVLYLTYISIFDNIIFFEKGLIPPHCSEKLINMILMRRTFISFSEIEYFDVIIWPIAMPYKIVMVSNGRLWRITRIWDLNMIAPIIQTGINAKFLVPPTFQKDSAAQIQIR